MTLTLYLHEISLVYTVVSLVETANLPFSDYKTEKCFGHTKEKCTFFFIQIILMNYIRII